MGAGQSARGTRRAPRLAAGVIAVGLASAAWLAAGTAAAQGDITALPEDARQRLLLQIKAGNEAFDQGEYSQALVHYDTAAGIAELASIHYRRGLCLAKLERNAEAIAAYRRFLELDPGAQEAGRVRADIALLEDKVNRMSIGRLSVNTTPTDADVRLDAADAQVLGKTPIFEISIEPGSHTLFISKAGYEARVERIEVSPGQGVSVSYQLAERVAAEGTVTFSSQPAGAAVRLGGPDGPVLGRTPLTTKVDAGEVTFHVASPGYKPRQETYKITAGQRLAVDYSLEREVQDIGPTPDPWGGTGRPRDTGVSGAGIGLTVVGVLLGVGAGGMWYLTESTIQEANDYDRRAAGNTRQELDDLESSVPLYKVGTYVTAGLGAATLVTGVILLLTSGSDAPPATTGWMWDVGPEGARVGYELEF